jgi:peptide/nickel transport system substrate-binding protein
VNTAWLELNTTHKPLDDPAFRRALARAIDVNRIVSSDYANVVLHADPTGLLPFWRKWVKPLWIEPPSLYDPAAAQAALTAAGYTIGPDGYYVNKDGSPIELAFRVPQGWWDWEKARDLIIDDLASVHIKAHALVGDFSKWQSDRNSGAFDMVIDNPWQLSDNPWTYWNGIFKLPIEPEQTSGNFGRYENSHAWSLVQQLDKTPPGDLAQRRAINYQLQDIFTDEQPLIPLWYGGLWSQSQSRYWTNWPSAAGARKYAPSIGRGYLQMTGIDMITHLTPSPATPS